MYTARNKHPHGMPAMCCGIGLTPLALTFTFVCPFSSFFSILYVQKRLLFGRSLPVRKWLSRSRSDQDAAPSGISLLRFKNTFRAQVRITLDETQPHENLLYRILSYLELYHRGLACI